MSAQRMSREDYLDYMVGTWDSYLAALKRFPGADQQRYAQQQGFVTLKDLIATINDWWAETLRIVPIWTKGELPSFDYDDYETFEKRSKMRHHHKSQAQIEHEFEMLRGQVAALLSELPDAAFGNGRIKAWLYRVIVAHYKKYEPHVPAAKG